MNSDVGRMAGHAPPGSDWMGYREAAAFLNCPVGTLHSWVHARKVPHVRLGRRNVRFSRVALTAWLNAHAIAAAR